MIEWEARREQVRKKVLRTINSYLASLTVEEIDLLFSEGELNIVVRRDRLWPLPGEDGKTDA